MASFKHDKGYDDLVIIARQKGKRVNYVMNQIVNQYVENNRKALEQAKNNMESHEFVTKTRGLSQAEQEDAPKASQKDCASHNPSK